MSIEPGTKLYRYSIRRNKLCMHTGVVNECLGRKRVVFVDGGINHSTVNCPRPEDIGVIRHIGLTLWMIERDDELAKQMFIDYEERQIHQIEKLLAGKREIVNMLRGE